MALPDYSMRQLLEAGAHFGHQTSRLNPKMDRYIYGSRNNIHIMDLSQTVPLLDQALKTVSDTVAGGGRVLFVGTKRQASKIIADAAKRSAQYFVNDRWLGGMLTNWHTISNSIKRLRELEGILGGDAAASLTKKELLMLTRENDKLERALGGIKDMGGTPDILFIIDTNKESIALQEAKKLGIPVVAVLDSNCDPDNVDYPIPGNDDAARAISLYCDLIAKAALDGIARQQNSSGVDMVAAADSSDDAAPLFTIPKGEPDDLTKISGVGPVLEGKLHALGITKFAQVAAFTADDIAKVDNALSFKGRIERDDWLKQAIVLASVASINIAGDITEEASRRSYQPNYAEILQEELFDDKIVPNVVFKDIRISINSLWKSKETLEKCDKIISYLERNYSEKLELSLEDVCEILDDDISNLHTMNAINILCKSEFSILKLKAKYVDIDGSEHLLSEEAFKVSEFKSPKNGALINDFKERIFPILVPIVNLNTQ